MATIPVATAMAYLAAGLSCLPATKAKKRPAIGGWKTWQTRLPTKVEVKEITVRFVSGQKYPEITGCELGDFPLVESGQNTQGEELSDEDWDDIPF